MKTGRPKGSLKPSSISGKARAAGIPVYLAFSRLRAGWDIDTALRAPKGTHFSKVVTREMLAMNVE